MQWSVMIITNTVIYFTIHKNCDISDKLEATSKDNKLRFAFQRTEKEPKIIFNRAVVLHNGTKYYFKSAWWDEDYGICYDQLVKIEKYVSDEDFQGFRYWEEYTFSDSWQASSII